jgi:hypothetical protein
MSSTLKEMWCDECQTHFWNCYCYYPDPFEEENEMRIKTENISVAWNLDFPKISCSCGMKYTLFAIIDRKGGKDWENQEYYGAERYEIYPQATVDYCPYCGAKNKFPRGEKKEDLDARDLP